jgi:hypothetical protein
MGMGCIGSTVSSRVSEFNKLYAPLRRAFYVCEKYTFVKSVYSKNINAQPFICVHCFVKLFQTRSR